MRSSQDKQRFAIAFLILMSGLGMALTPGGAAAQCDIPLIAQRVSTPPNVMILLDNSGSMNEAMWHASYDNSVRYSGAFDWDTMYYVGSAGSYSPRSFLGSPATKTIKANLVDGLHGQDGRYIGNYLNWVYYNATPEERDAIPMVTRQQVANTAVKAVMNAASGLRYGLTKFNFDNGGTIVAPVGTSKASLEATVDAMEADSWTPTAESMVTILNYFKTTGASAPIQYSCQQNFVILVTDGIPTKDRNIPNYIGDQDGDGNEPGSCASLGYPELPSNNDCSDYLDDVAYYMQHNDLRGDMDGDQVIVTYAIGFGIKAPLLAAAAENGDGLYREAWDLNSLTAELGTVVGDIVNRVSAGAAVAVVSTEAGDDDYLYRGKFLPGAWQGFLECYKLPYQDKDSPVWEAGKKLQSRSASSRTIYTSYNNNLVDFSQSNVSDLGYFIAPNGPGSGIDESDSFGPDADNDYDSLDQVVGPQYDPDYVSEVIDWVRGENVANYRDRGGWKLGDLVHSTPVVVGAPKGFRFDASYQDFRTAWSNRQSVVYVGSNDGMLHAFDSETGQEMWAYIPRRVLGKLEMLADPAYCHQNYVDLSPKAYDTKVNGQWRTVLVCGLRTGGDSYFAIDVTDPSAPDILWETSVPTLTSSFTEPAIIETHWGTVLWSGSGPNPNGKAYTSMIRIDNGNILLNYQLGATTGSMNAATAPAFYDRDHDGIIDLVYQGDLTGKVWRWDISNPGVWYIGSLYSGTQPIQARPALTLDHAGNVLVQFGTGKYMEASDVTDTSPQAFYSVQDDGTGATKYQSNLLHVTTGEVDLTGWDGWYRDLQFGPGERVTQPAVAVEGVVYFTSFRPSAGACSAGGRSYLYHVDFSTGTEVDSDGDGDLDDESIAIDLGDGVASRPVVNLSAEELIVQTSDARLLVEGLLVSPQRITVKAWRQQFDAVTTTDPTGQGTESN